MTSRNKREGWYGGTGSAYEGGKTLKNGVTVWKRDYVRHARYDRPLSLRASRFSKAKFICKRKRNDQA